MKKPAKFNTYLDAMFEEASRWSFYEVMENWGINEQELDECAEFENFIRNLDEIPEQKTCHRVEDNNYDHDDFECSKCGAVLWGCTIDVAGQGVFWIPKYCPFCGAKVVENE